MIFHSGHIFVIAKRTYERATLDQSEVMPAIVLATMGLECFVNETCERLSSEVLTQGQEVFHQAAYWLRMLEAKRASTLEKISGLTYAFTNHELTREAQPYQDLRFLYELRNVLVHRKPEGVGNWNPDDPAKKYEPHRYVKALVERNIIELPSPKAPPVWSQFVLIAETAKWAFNTSVAGVRHIVSLLPPGPFAHTTKVVTAILSPIP